MKRIYLLLLFVVAVAANSFGRSVDLKLSHYIASTLNTTFVPMTNGTVIFGNGGDTTKGPHPKYAFEYFFTVLSTSTDTLTANDTLHLKATLFGNFKLNLGSVHGIGKGDSVSFPYPPNGTQIVPTTQTTSGSTTINWCDSAWATDNANALVPDPNMTNNYTCAQVTFNFWVAGIGNVEVAKNDAVLYPNPASKKLSLLYNFEAGSSGAVIIITDVTGKVVATQNLNSGLVGSQEIPLNISNLNTGLYLLQIRTAEGKMASNKFYVDQQ